MLGQSALDSSNSSMPPSSDPNRLKPTRVKSNKKTGGQPGRTGITLEFSDKPDEIKQIRLDKRTLPKGNYKEVGYKRRQVFDIVIKRFITEYQAQILEDETGKQFIASFPDGVNAVVQYGNKLKAHSVYLSQYQLLPYNRISEYFAQQLNIPLSEGSIYNFNALAFDKLADFGQIIKDKLANSSVIHADETGVNVNVNSNRLWLHCASNKDWTHFSLNEKRGKSAMDEIGILPRFQGVLVHDHWKPYYKYQCMHSLCNAHHLRELTYAYEQEKQQ